MKLIANILWFVLGGFIFWILWVIIGFLFYITIIGIPIGHQCFKFAKLIVWPFGKEIETNFDKHSILNILWIIFFGIEICMACFTLGLALCITIIGIPFGLQWFKLGILSLIPFGAKIK